MFHFDPKWPFIFKYRFFWPDLASTARGKNPPFSRFEAHLASLLRRVPPQPSTYGPSRNLARRRQQAVAGGSRQPYIIGGGPEGKLTYIIMTQIVEKRCYRILQRDPWQSFVCFTIKDRLSLLRPACYLTPATCRHLLFAACYLPPSIRTTDCRLSPHHVWIAIDGGPP